MLWTTSISYINGMNLIVFLFLLSSFSYDHTCQSHVDISDAFERSFGCGIDDRAAYLKRLSFVGITASLHFKVIILN